MSPYKETVIGSFGSRTFIGEVPILLGAPYEQITVLTLEQSHLFRIKKGGFLADDIYLSSVTEEILRTMTQHVQLV
ncbi:MAG TPA: hypothetical protein VFY41_04805 [Nitrososphaeraceae archaeon]|nr:hypothetical protein [Nitrososphaeraceae archaeon]